jgi:Uri superfamily endonuclease
MNSRLSVVQVISVNVDEKRSRRSCVGCSGVNVNATAKLRHTMRGHWSRIGSGTGSLLSRCRHLLATVSSEIEWMLLKRSPSSARSMLLPCIEAYEA